MKMKTFKFYYLFFYLLLIVLVSCNSKQESAKENSIEKKQFKIAEIPVYIASTDEQADYMAINYWMNLDFSDSSSVKDSDIKELFLTDYTLLVSSREEDVIRKSFALLLKNSAKQEAVREFFISELEDLLYNPNSKLRNDNVYAVFLEQLLDENIDDLRRSKYLSDLNIVNQNRVGSKSNDFNYTLINGKTASLHKTKAEMTLLFFFNPDCHTCEDYIASIQNENSNINKYIKSGKIKVLAVYPDEEVDLWREKYDKIPASWVNCYDKEQILRSLYDLRAIPSVYLLDSDKNVILKDVYIEAVEEFLN